MSENLFKKECKKNIIAIHDAMDVLNGKWKISIIASLCFHKKRRFSELLNDIPLVSNRMLSKELKDLETNKLIQRTVMNSHPITVEYRLTEYGKKLTPMIQNLTEWGKAHRKEIIG